MKLSQVDLDIIAEALTARIETGDFTLCKTSKPDLEKGRIAYCSPEHEKALNELADRVVKAQEANQ